jgi:helix-turn-helix protein
MLSRVVDHCPATTGDMTMPSPTRPAAPHRALYSIREAQCLLCISHSQMYRLLGAGRLAAVKIGARTYIPAASIAAFVAALPPAQIRAA